MQSFSVVVPNKTGLHARPARVFVQEAQKFASTITVSMDGISADAKSILAVMGLGAAQGVALEIQACGVDEFEAITTIKRLFEQNLNERE